MSVGRRRFSADFQLVFRMIKGLIFITFVAILITLIAVPGMTFRDIIACILGFMPTGWGMLLVSGLFHSELLFFSSLPICSELNTKTKAVLEII